MKRLKIKFMLLVMAAMAGLGMSAQATLLAYEGFDAVGNIRVRDMPGGMGFTNNATLTNYRMRTYDSAGLFYMDGRGNTLDVMGQYGGMSGIVAGTKNLQLELTDGAISSGTIYMSFLFDADNATGGFNAGLLSGAVGASSNMGPVMQAMVRATATGWGTYGNPSGINDMGGPTNAGLHFVVSAINLDAGTMTTYFDPTDLTDVAGSASHTISSTGATFSPITHFGFSLGANLGYVDEIRIGTTMADAVPFTEAPVSMHWDFNDASNSTITEVNSGFDGLSSGGIWSAFTPLGAGTSLQFDGINDSVVVDPKPGTITNSFSISALVRLEGGQGTQRMIYSDYDGTGGFRFSASADNKWAFTTVDSTGTSYTLTGWDALLNKWVLVTAGFEITSGPDANGDYTGTGTIFADNKEVDSLANMKFHQPPVSSTLSIGFDATVSSAYFNGRIKDIYFRESTAAASASAVLAEILATLPADSLVAGKSAWDHGESELDGGAPTMVPGSTPYKYDWDVSPTVYNYDRARETVGYNPRYFPSKVSFDSANAPYMLGRVAPVGIGEYFYNHAVSLDNNEHRALELQRLNDSGAWETISLDSILRANGYSQSPRTGYRADAGDERVFFDAEGVVYVPVYTDSKNLILYSSDEMATWSVLDITTEAGTTPENRSRIIPVRDPANPSKLLANRAPIMMIQNQLVVLSKSGGVLSASATDLWPGLTRRLTLSTHSGDSSSVVAIGDDVHLAYSDDDVADDGKETHQYAVTWNTQTQTFSSEVHLGSSGGGNAVYVSPAMVMDSQGYLHVILPGQFTASVYVKSTNPSDTSAWDTGVALQALNVDMSDPDDDVSNNTEAWLADGTSVLGAPTVFVALEIDNADTLHVVTAQNESTQPGASLGLRYYRKKTSDAAFVDQGIIAYPQHSLDLFSLWYHKLTVDHKGNLTLLLHYYNNLGNGGVANGAGDDLNDAYAEKWPQLNGAKKATDPVLWRSADGGDSWNLAQTADFLQEMSLTYSGWINAFFTKAEKDAGLADQDANPDGDKINNLHEYALGGDPTDSDNQGLPQALGTMEADGTNWFTYVYPQRSDSNSGLQYYLEACDDLVFGQWTNVGYEVMGTGMIDDEFNAVTNRVSTDAAEKQFIRLIIK
ncbi:LamG-like jellyroll fold domain-containing protein [Pontiella sulfatireligans]|uniref:LamG-like jellyroll fold domain-containing protein n=1 Tax=Pontiella sulfatireligans TaxID=2750658 RepID=A0A6C2UFW0_9BACT|nr:LamG-like jellyroll fold domain-containing protein [Pontiella sulfatireligans]VGO19102.1 hypothetical protein SCARR_01158 [Pontiella sulfatireligans]